VNLERIIEIEWLSEDKVNQALKWYQLLNVAMSRTSLLSMIEYDLGIIA
jgi:hypothetical protein